MDEALDDPELFVPLTGPTLSGAKPRKHSHVYVKTITEGVTSHICGCGTVRNEEMARRGRLNRVRGADAERRAERRYGWAKIGELGSITDLRGTKMKVQSKASRTKPPVTWAAIFAELEKVSDGRIPAILFSFTDVKPGQPSEDFIVVRGRDWLELFGKDQPDVI
jgi:hypothetical protein